MARYIDADALLEELQEELECETPMYTEKENKCFNSGVKCAIRDVKGLPTADVAEVKHGEWKYPHCFPNGGSYIMKGCTVCGYTPRYGGDENPYTNFCPNCGAKMDGVRKENKDD